MTTTQDPEITTSTKTEKPFTKVNFAVKGWVDFVVTSYKLVASGQMEQEEFLAKSKVLLKAAEMTYKVCSGKTLEDHEEKILRSLVAAAE